MKYPARHQTFRWQGKDLPLCCGDRRLPVYSIILKRFAEQLDAMLSYHSRLLVIRLDLHLSRPMRDNKPISRFIDKLKGHLIQHYGCSRLGYGWVREQEHADKHHYHAVFILDRNKIQHPSGLIGWMNARWTAQGHPQIQIPPDCFIEVNRHNEKQYAQAFERVSYLAKTRGKGKRDPSVNDQSFSRLKPKIPTLKKPPDRK